MKIHSVGLPLRSLPAVLRAAVWSDLARPSIPFPGGRRGGRILTAVVWLLAVAAYFAGTLDLAQHYGFGYGPAMALTVARAVPLVLALSRPRAAWWTQLAAVTLTAALARPYSAAEPWPWAVTSVLTLATTLGVVGLRAPRRAIVAMWCEVLVVGTVLAVTVPAHGGLPALLPLTVILAVAAVTANAVRGRGDVQARLLLAEERGAAEQARAALLAERARIARELHDVVAHHMSVITVQADSAPYRVADVSPGAAGEFAAIAAEARRSLAEMRRLLHVLRNEDSPDGEHAPQPDVSDLPALLEATRRAGVDARLDVADDVLSATGLPAAVALSAYRLVQEALSNVVRHAPGARADVEVRRSAGALRVSVVNSPPGDVRPAVETRTGGHGLVGMRERVAMLDGEFTAEPLADGGFRMAAVLPLPGTP
ncbi:sensor histidine kinase [Kitasatospora sp. A2-31]|uniref:sensor histidine kinase n=1 Tax=Kitasatospora sp. A2-31 TaxID=2916414 RepID=UPI001EEA9A09|nr:histidine kinase [Kitasatospora sp. A2-31]MCG6494753.1 histidine kinase [Kitasatospora sp. A2-31]